MVAWPSAFPAPEVGFSGGFGSSVNRVLMDGGQHRQRPVRRGKRYVFKASFVLRGFRLAMFNAWFKYKLQDGVLPVTLTLPIDGAMTEVEAFFTESKYQVILKEPPFTWEVQIELETHA